MQLFVGQFGRELSSCRVLLKHRKWLRRYVFLVLHVPQQASNPGPCVEEVYHRHMVSYLCPGNKALSCSSAQFMCSHETESSGQHTEKEWPTAFWDSGP